MLEASFGGWKQCEHQKPLPMKLKEKRSRKSVARFGSCEMYSKSHTSDFHRWHCELVYSLNVVAQGIILWSVYSFNLFKVNTWWAILSDEVILILKYNEIYSSGENAWLCTMRTHHSSVAPDVLRSELCQDSTAISKDQLLPWVGEGTRKNQTPAI